MDCRAIWKIIIVALSALTGTGLQAQKIDSIYFHLYTDSLKKGTYNYINVDGKLSDGRWLPLTSKEIDLSATAGTFVGNSLFIDSAFNGEKVTVSARLKQNPILKKEVTIYIKKKNPAERLKTVDELMNGLPHRRRHFRF